MATSEDLTLESEELFDICCSPCSDDDRISEAKKFCVECGLHFCENCVRFHKKIPILQSHEIVNLPADEKGENKQDKIELPTERCSIHHGKLVDMFCKNHDEVCCEVCIAIKHSNCVNIDYVPDVAKDVRTCQEYVDVIDSVTAVLGNIKLEKQKRTSNLVELEEEKDKLLDGVNEYQNDLIEKIKVITESTKLEILSDFEDKKKAISADVDTLDILIPAMETSLRKLLITNEAQLFVNIKARKRVIKDEESFLRKLSLNWKSKKLNYVFNESLKCTVSKMKAFGTSEKMEDVREYEAKLHGKFNIKENAESSSYSITGICPLLDGSFIIADNNNKKVKKLNSNYEVKQSVAVNGSPIGICTVGRNEVAVSLYNTGKIQFVSVNDNLRLTTSIQVDGRCCGIYYSESSDELLACCEDCINVYNKTGNLLRVLKTGANGEPLFSALQQVIVKNPNNEIVVSDETRGLTSIDSQGKLKWSLKDQEFASAWGLCILPSGTIFTSNCKANIVLQVDKNGNKIGVLIGGTEGLKYPYSLAFDSHNSRLIVGMESKNIYVYTLSPKS